MSSTNRVEPAAHTDIPMSYFDLQASWGLTKHFGGTAATDELLIHCGVRPGMYVLEIGCGVGMTPCRTARSHNCHVVAIDLSARMIDWARQRVQRLGLDERVSLSVADAQRLPFADNAFDAVICESVTAFVPDKALALAEYVRVTRPGGLIGLNEGIWLQTPPPDLIAYMTRALGGAVFLTAEGWTELLARAGLTEIIAEPRKVNAVSQWRSEISRLDRDDLKNYGQAWRQLSRLLVTSPDFRRYVRELASISPNLLRAFDYFGYGIFTGRKAS